MIPAYLTTCLAVVLGFIGVRFPGAFNIPGLAASYAYHWFRDVANQVRLVVTRVILVLAFTYVGLAWAIQYHHNTVIYVTLFGSGVTFTLVLIALDGVRAGTVSAFAHLKQLGTAISGFITIQTIPFSLLPPWQRAGRVLLCPIYGLYLLAVLPTMGAAQLMVMVGELGPTMDKWFKNTLAIIAGISIANWVLGVLIIFQNKNGLNIVDLETLGYWIIVVAVLINLIYLTGESMASLKNFMNFCGVTAIVLTVTMMLQHWLPSMFSPLGRLLTNRYDSTVANANSSTLVAWALLVTILAVITAGIPWSRAHQIHRMVAAVLLLLWIFPHLLIPNFYQNMEFWIGLAIVLAVMLIPKKGSASVTANPANPATPAPATAGGGGHGGGHPFPWKTVFGTIVAVTVVALLFFIAFRMIDQSAHAQPQPWVNPLPLPASSPVVTLTAPTSANLEDFRVLKDGTADGVWEFQLDAREPWKTLPNITVTDGDTVEFSASGRICGASIGCIGPKGQQGPARTSVTRPDEFPYGEAWFQSLVARIGPDKIQVGDHKTYTVPAGSGMAIELMANYRLPEIATASGGFRVNVTIRKK